MAQLGANNYTSQGLGGDGLLAAGGGSSGSCGSCCACAATAASATTGVVGRCLLGMPCAGGTAGGGMEVISA